MSGICTISLILTLATIFNLSSSRELQMTNSNTNSLEARLLLSLKDEGGLVNCWNAMMQLHSCSNEIVLFFMNGESHLGLDCCRAIRTITHHCWPSMLNSLGFTASEGDVLRGFCDAENAAPPADEPSASEDDYDV